MNFHGSSLISVLMPSEPNQVPPVRSPVTDVLSIVTKRWLLKSR